MIAHTELDRPKIVPSRERPTFLRERFDLFSRYATPSIYSRDWSAHEVDSSSKGYKTALGQLASLSFEPACGVSSRGPGGTPPRRLIPRRNQVGKLAQRLSGPSAELKLICTSNYSLFSTGRFSLQGEIDFFLADQQRGGGKEGQ